MKISTDELTTKLFVCDEGDVWCLHGDKSPANTNVPVSKFVNQEAALPATRVRVAATAANVPLILALHEYVVRGDVESLQVGSPRMFRGPGDCEDPGVALLRMRAWDKPASLGGWHHFTDRDYPSYALAYNIGTGCSEELAFQLLKAHPAWPALSFITTVDYYRCACLMGTLLDPRWYIDICAAERTSKMESFLGLFPANAYLLWDEKSRRGRKFENFQLTFGAWRGSAVIDGDYPDEPGRFLERAYQKAGGGWKGMLRSTQRFVRFVRHFWLSQLAGDTSSKDGLFVADHMFKTAEEVDAFRRHVNN
jgi:hypothetical protein